MSQFDKFDKACKRLNLSNADQGILLQVTPTMISRYRNRVSVMSAKRCKEYFPVALKVLKALRDQG